MHNLSFVNDDIQEKHIFSVSELNELTRQILENTFPMIWIEGEISNLSQPSSGHIYFTLKDHAAQVRCAMFRTHKQRINFVIENGMHVLLQAKVSLYGARGDFQIIAYHLEKSGDGALQRAFEQLKQKLSQEGLFDLAHKKMIPPFCKRIGIITSPTGAAIRDILSVLKRRACFIPIIIYPVQVQGDLAAAQVIDAIKLANERAECDVLILARGGGSLEDLAAFNDEALARAIFNSNIPLVTGIGHEIDFTIADFVADVRAPTPSVAAELVAPHYQELENKFSMFEQKLLATFKHRLQQKKYQLLELEKKLKQPDARIRELMQHFDFLQIKLERTFNEYFLSKKQQFSAICSLLNAVSPIATLARGYAIVHDEAGNIVRDTNQLQLKQKLSVQLAVGKFICSVETI